VRPGRKPWPGDGWKCVRNEYSKKAEIGMKYPASEFAGAI
jgi:hypothetical protein